MITSVVLVIDAVTKRVMSVHETLENAVEAQVWHAATNSLATKVELHMVTTKHAPGEAFGSDVNKERK